MICIEEYMRRLTALLRAEFGDELVYVGLQGSYLRGEAAENSDVDAMVVLKTLDRSAMEKYRAVIAQMGDDAAACGFICSESDLKAWNPLECCQLVHTTKDIFGTLQPLLPKWSREDEINYVKLSLNNFYHELCHRYIHRGPERSAQKLPQMEKSLFFVLQNLHYLDTGVFCVSRAQLDEALCGADGEIFRRMRRASEEPFEELFDALLKWCQSAMERIA